MRQCSNPECKRPIEGCNGFVKAGDLMEAMAGERPVEQVREMCGKCGLLAFIYEELFGDCDLFFLRIGWL